MHDAHGPLAGGGSAGAASEPPACATALGGVQHAILRTINSEFEKRWCVQAGVGEAEQNL